MKKTIFAVVLILLIALTVLAWRSLHEVHEARLLFREMQRLAPDALTNDDAKRLAARFRSHLLPPQQVCTEVKCEYGFSFDNSILVSLKLAPYLRLNAGIKLEQGKLALLGVVFHQERNPRLDISVFEFRAAPELEPFKAELVERSGEPNLITVKITGAAQQSQRSAAFGLNPECLVRVAGCRSFQQIAPELFQIVARR
jgi:hypothetical protein